MSASTLQMDIIAPEKRIFSGEVSSVVFPGVTGSFGVLPGHAPLVSQLKAGVIKYETGGEKREMEIDGGIVEINNGKISVCVELHFVKEKK